MKSLEKYIDGLDMNQFKHIKDISHYNSNYYVGLDGDLLYGDSDDDNTTEWFVIVGEESCYLGESYCDDNEKLCRYTEQQR